MTRRVSDGSYSSVPNTTTCKSRKRSEPPSVSDSDSSLTAEDGKDQLFPFTYGLEDFYTHDEFVEIGQASNSSTVPPCASSPSWLHPSHQAHASASQPAASAREDIEFTKLLDELAWDSDSDCYLHEHEVSLTSTPMNDYMNSWKCNPPKKRRRLATFIRPTTHKKLKR